MSKEITGFIQSNTTPDHLGVFIRALDLFERLGLEDYESPLQTIISTMELQGIDEAGAIDQMEDEVRRTLFEVLRAHCVTVNAATTTQRMVDILLALVQIPDYEDIESITRYCEGDDDDVEKLASLLALTSHVDAETYLLDLLYVNPLLIDRIMQVLDQNEDMIFEDADINLNRKLYGRLKRFVTFLNVPSVRASRIVDNGGVLGLELAQYAAAFCGNLSQVSPNDAAIELFAFSLISADCQNGNVADIERVFERIFTEAEHAMQVRRILHVVFKKFTDYDQAATMQNTEVI